MIRVIRRPSRKAVVLAALPLVTAASAVVGVAASASQTATAAQPSCTTFFAPKYLTVGEACTIDQGQNGAGFIGTTYPGGGEAGSSVHVGNDVYGAGVSTQGTHGTLTICDGPYPYYCANTPF
jgi:hypothetical protein